MFARGKSKERTSSRKVTPPSPSYMSNDQFAAYLAGLRNHRVNRPTGARPPPPPAASTRTSLGGGRPSFGSTVPSQAPSETSSLHQRNHSDAPVGSVSGRPSLAASVSSRYSMMTQGRDYIPDKPLPVRPLKPSEVVPSSRYIERGQRWMEKEEAVSLRQAMEDLDLRDELKALPKEAPEDEEERRIYNAALDEAAELVWRHQNPDKVPQPGAAYRYRPHLRKNSYQHARTASAGLYGEDVVPTGLARDPAARSVSGSSASSDGFGSVRSKSSLAYSRRQSSEHGTPRQSLDNPRQASTESSRKTKSYGPLSSGSYFSSQGPHQSSGHRRRSSMKRNISRDIEKPFSGDQIWEEPESQNNTPQKAAPGAAKQSDDVEALRMKPKNPLNRVQFAPEKTSEESSEKESSTPPAPPPKGLVSRTEIYRNPPSQSRNPQYTSTSPSASSQNVGLPKEQDPVSRINGVEIRSEDIRQATSMKLKDRSPKLPTPSAVSDTPGRPIVSFDRNWKPAEEVAADQKIVLPEEESKSSPSKFNNSTSGTVAARSRSPFVARQEQRQQQQQQQQAQGIPSIAVSEAPPPSAPSSTPARRNPFARPAASAPSIQIDAPAPPSIPTIAVSQSESSRAPPSIPTIVLPDDPTPPPAATTPSIPVIVTPGDASPAPSAKPSSRPLPTPTSNSAQRRGHWSPAPQPPPSSRSTALCGDCYQPITGRFISLSGIPQRFHPHCFRCYVCGTSLEALEISPEPDHAREARLARISARRRGEVLPEAPGETMAEDGDARLRFYCHLDWHELFAPRCETCKTPILGEHVVALGGKHFHAGHFFCAECGDPFGKGETHIEKDGYAWCVSCQTKRTERRAPKCKACRGPVVGSYVQALGGEWHEACFRCGQCGGGFGDGQVFPVDGMGVVCTGCRARMLKA
ncbi:Paxillin [Coniochaeta hoffmannii]|uniref:Paxillin n=1 Tax=Coniochaeta hoffmannii TaxID=91930 RepID=A0AA38VGJ9_9PEZI|nr:Paxillin [Coniochaeta hoffmannii]